MSRFSRYDTDEERLPEGMTRVGYDADTQVTTFQDSDGSYWESAPGNAYGQLTRVGQGTAPDEDDAMAPFLISDEQRPSWRADLMPMLNFGVLVGVCLLLFFWYLHWAAGSGSSDNNNAEAMVSCPLGAEIYTVEAGDVCWSLADDRGVPVDEIVKLNHGDSCEKLQIGSKLCLPGSIAPV